MNSGMAQLDNLGQQIEESVYQGLEPVRAIEIVFNMKGGIGGTTIATHLPQGKKFIIRNNQIYLCSRSISDEDGSCNGTLTTFQVNNKKDYCYYKNSYSIVNNYICIGGNSILVTNNNIICNSNTETPALLITINEFNKLCDEISKTVEYKYIANPSDPAHVEIPNKNKHVKCRNNQPGVCIFSESQSISQFQQNKIQSDNYSTVFI
ncbi:hypothetical protein NQ314_011543 [Rhamnusium bicolor]|uniref:Uncharacterized protein n=1 Tax=Rhamnusium bicolor TaxID=1586634 RepID=A0AAV8XI03_9CUCU|nr:hypothetical protein NQ314_011543 [Rhamnusium bicolor]